MIHWGGIGPVIPPLDDGRSLLESILTLFSQVCFFIVLGVGFLGQLLATLGPKCPPRGTKNRRFGSPNPPKIDPGTENSIFKKSAESSTPSNQDRVSALPKINKNRPRAPSGGGRRVQRRSKRLFLGFSRLLSILDGFGGPLGDPGITNLP